MQELGIGEPSQPLAPTATVTPTTSSAAEKRGTETPQQDRTDSVPKPDKDEGAKEDGDVEGRGLSATEKRLVSEWVPLGLNFGIPLFNEAANKTVCEKVCLGIPTSGTPV